MRRLILMRHAKSSWRALELADHDRPLSKRGKRSAKALGAWLRDKGYLPDEVLCSSSERTGQTLLGLALDAETPTRFKRDLYHADPQTMMDLLKTATGPSVLLLGHNPGICDFAHRLLQKPPPFSRFEDYPTGATLVCDFEATSWLDIGWFQAKAVDFVVPRNLTD